MTGWQNKYWFPLLFGVERCFICFSEAEKFLAIFSPALIFLPLNYRIRECGMAHTALTLVLSGACPDNYRDIKTKERTV